MHSTLRTELRGTQRVFKLLRPRPNNQSRIQNRPFTNRTCLHSKSTPLPGTGTDNLDGRVGEESGPASSSQNPRSAELGSEIEKWINQLSKNDMSLHVWDTISEKQEDGTWRLLPQVKSDLEKIEQWATEDDKQQYRPFGLKIEDGRIRPLTSQELRTEQDASPKGAVLKEVKGSSSVTSYSTSNVSKRSHTQKATDIEQTADRSASSEQDPIKVLEEQQSTGGDLPPKETDSTAASRFYGSPAARRQRAQKLREKSSIFLLPEWFQQRNVLLRGEKQLDPSLPAQVMSIRDKRSKASKLALVVPRPEHKTSVGILDVERLSENPTRTGVASVKSGDTTAISKSSSQAQISLLEPSTAPSSSFEEHSLTSAAVELVEHERSTTDSIEHESPKKQTQAPGGDNEPAAGSDNSTPQNPRSTKRSPILIPLPDTKRQYYIEEAQHNELITTARGKLRRPASGSTNHRPSALRDHLIIHHTAIGAETYLDRLVEDIARRLECDLITLDAQDIAGLISGPDVDQMLVNEARSMTFEVYGEIYKDPSAAQEVSALAFAEEVEDGDDDPEGPMQPNAGGWKPFTIDLKDLFNNRSSRRQSTPFMPKHFLTELAGPRSNSKPPAHVFSSMIESVLMSAKNKRAANVESKDTDPADGDTEDQSKNATIVHIKDLKSIQFTNIGKQFLNQLYEQAESLREAGEAVMLVGTEASHADDSTYDKSRIRNLQDAGPDEISTTMVITPAHPDETNRDFLVDKVRRRAIINARHLWTVLQAKSISIGPLQPGFWTRDFIESLPLADQIALNEGLWSFSHVQRLAAVIAGEDLSGSKQPIGEAASTIRLSDKSKFAWADQTKQNTRKEMEKDIDKSPEHEQDQASKDRLAKIKEKANKHEKKLLSGVIEPRKIPTTFKDIHIPPETVEALQTLTTLSLVRPDAFKYGVLASDRIPGLLLYGPPGTGKTLAAKAVARESGATMLEVSAADINDMYVGEGEKNVKALFSLAKKLSPCVVFLDEADAMFSARSNEGRRVSHRELLNQFLKEWDGMSNDSGSAFIMVATNRPMDLDDAVLRRLPRRVLVDLPTEVDRLEILKIHLRQEILAPDVNLSQLATKTPFYSGSDLKNVAVAAALNAVREENEQAKQHTGDEPYQYPEKRTLTALHFEKALEEISASISEDMSSLKAIKKFDEQYGDKKGRKKKAPKWGFRSAKEADQVLDTVKVRA